MATAAQLDRILASADNCKERNEDDIHDRDSSKQLENFSDHDSEIERSLKINDNFLSDDEAAPVIAQKKRTQRFSDSDGDVGGKNNHIEKIQVKENIRPLPESISTPRGNKKSRIRKVDSSESDNGPEDTMEQKNGMVNKKYKSNRIESKSNKLKNKFKNLMSHTKNNLKMSSEDENIAKPSFSGSELSDGDYSCLKIKQNVKSAANSMKSICDPDTSDEEGNNQPKMYKKKSKPKMTKSTSPKPIRMSAKEAMENMQKIKSESNRMLREKGVSLPYHRPKALTLKDIMNRRKPAVSSDGKTLPIKMNESQLREYVMLLEQRQKEVIELCKSDTEEEEKEDEPKDELNEKLNNKETTNESNNSIELTPTVEPSNELTLNNSNNSIELTPTVEPSNELTLNQIQNKDDSNVDQSMDNNDIQIHDKQTESLEPMQLVIQTVSLNNDNTININNEISNADDTEKNLPENILLQKEVADESQNISLHYDSERINTNQIEIVTNNDNVSNANNKCIENENKKDDDFSDSDCEINMDEIDKIIREAEIICDKPDTPKLTGAPGTVINLENEDLCVPRKLSGVELLKERFQFFAKLKTKEDIEKDREKKFKPGTQHLKLKHELEQQIAEQRSIEWEKRLEEEKQLKSEMNIEQDEDDIEKLESKLQEIDKEKIESESSDSEEELIENDVVMEDKPLKRNPMLDDEADVSDDEKGDVIEDDGDLGDDESDDELDSGESSSESEDDSKPKKGRILKAFEDSDDEKENEVAVDDVNKISTEVTETVNSDAVFSQSQDDELQLAQNNKHSDDLFSTQSTIPETVALNKNTEDNTSTEISTPIIYLPNTDPSKMIRMDINPDNMNVCESQSQNEDVCMEGIVGLCTGNFSENLVSSQMLQPLTQSQEFGDDIAAMCTGKFYDNPLVSQESNSQLESIDKSEAIEKDTTLADSEVVIQNNKTPASISNDNDNNKENTILNSILDELGDLEDKPKQYKYFSNETQSRDNKKKFTIESDDESNLTSPKKVKKLKKRKAEQRALNISDDEEEVEEEVPSDIEEDENEDRIIEYDSEENEIEVKQPKIKPSKKGMRDFFENEAELSSEDEWIGSGDEDERGLDTMEREEGDDETFHQGQLRRELGQIHMREVLDQDKREVRLIQELLFEDGDLGDGHRQRKFRWKNADGEEETGMNPQEITDTQEDEFESEEQWRKERHEREMFIRKMRQTDEEEKNTSINRSTIIKANLCSRSMSSLISEIKVTKTEDIPAPEKKTAKDIPSPKKSFTMFKQNYHTSLLTRGRGALARLAALATPLADDDTPRNISTSRGNFVFTAITPDEAPKVTKRKAEKMVHTPRLIKKMKTEDLNKQKPTLFDHIKI